VKDMNLPRHFAYVLCKVLALRGAWQPFWIFLRKLEKDRRKVEVQQRQFVWHINWMRTSDHF
jgi:hypothetical protein